jgi:hypothetical protein
MSVTTIDIYKRLFGRKGIADGNVIDMAEHGRVGGVSTGQPFKFVSNIEIDPTDTSQANPSIVLGYTGGDLTTITKTINGDQYQQTLTYDLGNLVGISAWVKL